jgi:hypothetical protein
MQKLNWMRTTARHGPYGQTLGFVNARPLQMQSARKISWVLDRIASTELRTRIREASEKFELMKRDETGRGIHRTQR